MVLYPISCGFWPRRVIIFDLLFATVWLSFRFWGSWSLDLVSFWKRWGFFLKFKKDGFFYRHLGLLFVLDLLMLFGGYVLPWYFDFLMFYDLVYWFLGAWISSGLGFWFLDLICEYVMTCVLISRCCSLISVGLVFWFLVSVSENLLTWYFDFVREYLLIWYFWCLASVYFREGTIFCHQNVYLVWFSLPSMFIQLLLPSDLSFCLLILFVRIELLNYDIYYFSKGFHIYVASSF